MDLLLIRVVEYRMLEIAWNKYETDVISYLKLFHRVSCDCKAILNSVSLEDLMSIGLWTLRFQAPLSDATKNTKNRRGIVLAVCGFCSTAEIR